MPRIGSNVSACARPIRCAATLYAIHDELEFIRNQLAR
jgi:hypothetical protein